MIIKSLSGTQDKLLNARFLISRVLIWNSRTGRKEPANVRFLYQKRRKIKSLSVTQDKRCNARFPISIVMICNERSCSVYKERNGGNQSMLDSHIKSE